MRKKVVSAGLVCLDVTPVFPPTSKKAADIFVPGRLIEVGDVELATGGSVANTGLAMRKYGLDVTLMGMVGRDPFGRIVMDILEKSGNVDGVIVTDKCSTTYSIVLAPPGVDRIFLHFPGSDDVFSYDDVDYEKVRGADLFHFGYASLMRRLYENGGDGLIRMFRKVKELGVLTSLDMAAIDPHSDAAKADWRAILKKLMPYVDFFVPSVEELCFMLDRERHASWLARAGGEDVTGFLDVERDVKPLAEQLVAWGGKAVFIKCGRPGLYLYTAPEERMAQLGERFRDWADKRIFELSYAEDCFKAATGAGDTSIAAFLKAMLEGYAPERCLQLATAAGACCVTAYDALSGLLPFAEMEQRIDEGWAKLPLENRKQDA